MQKKGRKRKWLIQKKKNIYIYIAEKKAQGDSCCLVA